MKAIIFFADRAGADEVDPGIDYVQEESAEEDFD